MYKEIKIGSKTVPMTANAATEYRCKQTFKQTLLKEFLKIAPAIESGAELSAEESDVVIDVSSKLGYIMAMQAAKADMTMLNEETYLQWLEEFEPLDILNATGDIIKLWIGQKATTSKPKKAGAPTTGK